MKRLCIYGPAHGVLVDGDRHAVSIINPVIADAQELIDMMAIIGDGRTIYIKMDYLPGVAFKCQQCGLEQAAIVHLMIPGDMGQIREIDNWHKIPIFQNFNDIFAGCSECGQIEQRECYEPFNFCRRGCCERGSRRIGNGVL